MPRLEERIRRGLAGWAPPVDPDRVLQDVRLHRSRLRARRWARVALLTALAVAGSAAGLYGLIRVFRAPERPAAGPPEGTIVFHGKRQGSFDILVVSAAGGQVVALTDGGADESYPAVSPDGALIAFVSDRDGGDDIHVMDADGTDERTLTAIDGWFESHPAWSPDGTRIVFTGPGRPGTYGGDIFVVNADGSDMRRLTEDPQHEEGPAWSPDGTRIAFVREIGDNAEIFVMDADGGNVTRLTDHPALDVDPAWSPDGTRIAFTSNRTSEYGTPTDIYAMNADGTGVVRLTEDPGRDIQPAWSPDGTHIAFVSDRDGDLGIYVMEADGTGVTRLVASGAGPAWPADLAVVASPTPTTTAATWPSLPTEEEVEAAWGALPAGWSKLPPPPVVRARAAAVWTGRGLFYWGGDSNLGGEHHADGAFYDPVARTWHPLPPVNIAGRSSPAAVWTGREVIVWGGWPPNDDGAAFDPESGTWRVLPPAPLSPRAPVAAVWTGREMIVWGGVGSLGRTTTYSDGAAYDPATDSWRTIAAAPIEVNQAKAAWTGREMVVHGSLLDNNNLSASEHAIGAAYDAAADAWRALPPYPLSPQASSVAWTGREMVAWDYELAAGAYDPAAHSWRDLPHLPIRFQECYPQNAVAGNLLLAWFCGQAAELDPATDDWRAIETPDVPIFGRPVSAGSVVLFPGAAHEGVHNALWAYKPG